jgi:hypothetical protein
MLLFDSGPIRETQPAYLRPETFLVVAAFAGLIYVVLFAAAKVVENR